MGLFDLLDEKEQMFANGTPEPTPHTPAVSPSSSVVDVVNDDGNSEPVKGASIVAEDDDWISTDAKKTPSRMTVELYDTKVHNKILPENLIWAPHYRYKDRLFPARLCANNELQFESWVKTWPLPPDEAVVEIFCQEKSSASSPLIIVKQKKLLPFWKRNSTDVKSNYEGTLEWNETRLGNLHLTLHEKHNKTNAQVIYDKIKAKAQEFLEKALAYEAQNTDLPDESTDTPAKPIRGKAKMSTKIATPPSPAPKPAESEARKPSAPASPFFKSLLHVQRTPSKVDMSLSVGDFISYCSREGSRVTKIVGFTSNPKVPLELEDKTVLHDTDLVKRLHPDPTSYKGYSEETHDIKHIMLEKFSLHAPALQTASKSGRKRTVSSVDSDTQEPTRVVRSKE